MLNGVRYDEEYQLVRELDEYSCNPKSRRQNRDDGLEPELFSQERKKSGLETVGSEERPLLGVSIASF